MSSITAINLAVLLCLSITTARAEELRAGTRSSSQAQAMGFISRCGLNQILSNMGVFPAALVWNALMELRRRATGLRAQNRNLRLRQLHWLSCRARLTLTRSASAVDLRHGFLPLCLTVGQSGYPTAVAL